MKFNSTSTIFVVWKHSLSIAFIDQHDCNDFQNKLEERKMKKPHTMFNYIIKVLDNFTKRCASSANKRRVIKLQKIGWILSVY